MKSEAPLQPLRFVVLCNGFEFEAWQAKCLREAINSPYAEAVGFVFRSHEPARPTVLNWKRRWKDKSLALWKLFDRFYIRRLSAATRLEDLTDLFADMPSIRDQPSKVGKFGEALSEEAIRFIRNLRPDFILRFSYGILRGEVLSVAKYGVWSYHHGDPAHYRGQPPGFWELFHGSPVAGSVLQVLGDQLDAGKILHEGTFQTYASSYIKTRDTLYLGSASWVRRTCTAIALNGWESAEIPAKTQGPIYRQPHNAAMLRFYLKTLIASIRTQARYRLYRQDWNVGLVKAPIARVAGLEGTARQRQATSEIIWMDPPKNQFYADPFGSSEKSGKTIRIFFELFDWRTNLGRIATATYSDGQFSDAVTSLSASTHLSYPFLIDSSETYSFIPENSAAHEVSKYALSKEGIAQEKHPIIADTELIDTTFVKWGGKFWAFATINSEIKNTELFIFHAGSMLGPWDAHDLNPVKSDVSNARPAGTLFIHDQDLYRPAQDCSSDYGAAIVVNKITRLNEKEFEEEAVSSVQPNQHGPYPNGLHTLSQVGDLTLIDGAKLRNKFLASRKTR